MSPDRAQAEAYVAALAGSANSPVTWQLLSDSKTGRRLSVVYHLPLEKVWGELCRQNGVGVGIFVMVNAGDGGNRAAANVIGLRAVFVDDDNGSIELGGPRLASLPPSIAVKSKRGLHLYWLLRDGEALSRFSDAQVQLAAHFGTDPAVKDLPRVLRVPGFFHMKDPNNPVMVRLIDAAPERRYTIDEVLAAYPAPTDFAATPASKEKSGPLAAQRTRRTGVHLAPGEGLAVLNQFRKLGVFRWAQEHPEDVSREAWRGIATNIAAAVAEDEAAAQDAGEQLFQELSALDSERYSAADTSRTFKDALKSAREFGPMRYATLMAAGVPEEVCVGAKVAAAPVAVAKKLFNKQGRRNER